MEKIQKPGPTILVIMGGGGDLTWCKLAPATPLDNKNGSGTPKHGK